MATIYGIAAHFGLGFPTKLPEGWQLIESKKHFAFGIDPDGKKYLLSHSKAFPVLTGGPKENTIGIDTENGVINLIADGIQARSFSLKTEH